MELEASGEKKKGIKSESFFLVLKTFKRHCGRYISEYMYIYIKSNHVVSRIRYKYYNIESFWIAISIWGSISDWNISNARCKISGYILTTKAWVWLDSQENACAARQRLLGVDAMNRMHHVAYSK
jgi:hypothetical protein